MFGWLTRLLGSEAGEIGNAYVWHEKANGKLGYFCLQIGDDGERQQIHLSDYNKTMSKLCTKGYKIVDGISPKEQERQEKAKNARNPSSKHAPKSASPKS